MSICLTFESWRNYPGTKFRGAVSKLGDKIQIHGCVYVLFKTWEMVISRRRFAENEKEMNRNKKKLVKGVQSFCFCSLNMQNLWRCRYCRVVPLKLPTPY